MNRSARRCRLSATLLGLLMACGCRNAQPCCSNGDPSASAIAVPADGSAPVVHTTNKTTSMDGAAAPIAQPSPVIAAATAAPNDRPATPRFAHDPEYHWLMGTISYSRSQDAWLLRYAPFEEEDRYGGVVTLTDCGRMKGATEGQVVRAEGHLIDPGSRQLRPAFEVRALAPVGP